MPCSTTTLQGHLNFLILGGFWQRRDDAHEAFMVMRCDAEPDVKRRESNDDSLATVGLEVGFKVCFYSAPGGILEPEEQLANCCS